MNNTISYTRLQDDSAVYKVTIRKQLTAVQMRSVKGHLYNNPYYEWKEDKQRYCLGDGLYMRFGANNDQSVYWDIVREKDENCEYEELDFYGYSDPESGIRDLMREWDLHSYDPVQQFSVRSVTLQAMVELDTDIDLFWYLLLICKSVCDSNYKVQELTPDKCVIGCKSHKLTVKIERDYGNPRLIFKLKEGRRAIKDYNQAEKVISPYETLNHYYDDGEDLISALWRMVLKNTGDYLHRDDSHKKLREVYPKRAGELAEVADQWNSYADREEAEMNILADMVAEGRTPAAAWKKLTDYREAFARAGVSMIYLPDDVPVAQMPSVWTLLEGEKRASYEEFKRELQERYNDEDEAYCDSCYERGCGGTIHNYSYKPEPIFYGEGPLYLGVELEVDEAGKDNVNAAHTLRGFNQENVYGYVKSDGSLNDGFELVTHPCTVETHLQQVPWRETLEALRGMGYRSHAPGTCGLHVHVSRKALGKDVYEQEETIAKLLYIFERFWQEILRFSRRTESQINHWAARYGYKDRGEEILKEAKHGANGRYACINLTNTDTIEFRVFRGTLKYNTVIATLQFVVNLCRVAIPLPEYRIQEFSWPALIEALTQDNCPELVQYLKERNLYVNEPVAVEREV